MQAKLPDTNQAWIYYRHMGVQSISEKDYSSAIAAINEMIALFPNEYRIEINTEKYKQTIREKLVLVCTKCNTEINYNDIKIMKLQNLGVVRLVTGTDFNDGWYCTSCHKINKLQNTRVIKEQKGLPFYHKIIPEPPIYHGISDRKGWHNRMVKWFYDSLEEVDHQLGKYREEYEGLEKLEEISGSQDAN